MQSHLLHGDSDLSTKQCGKNWNNKPEFFKRALLLNTFADTGLNIIDIRTKYICQTTSAIN